MNNYESQNRDKFKTVDYPYTQMSREEFELLWGLADAILDQGAKAVNLESNSVGGGGKKTTYTDWAMDFRGYASTAAHTAFNRYFYKGERPSHLNGMIRTFTQKVPRATVDEGLMLSERI